MASVMSLFTGLCGFRKKPPAPEKESGERSFSPEKETVNTKTNGLQPEEPPKMRHSNASEIDPDAANLELPLPPARKALRETNSFNNKAMKSAPRKKLSASLSIQITKAMSMSVRRDGEAEKSSRKKKSKAENSILVRPIILGEKCRGFDDDSDEDSALRMQRNRTYHPRSMSSITLSRTNSRIDPNAIPEKEIPIDSARNERKERETE
ncbi:PREDICTED: uncharacterized protein LOC104799160 [Tarenaya hassleriana]|uniref:uncharacterized protein LOC104799160 n=1 Tax=Tarenaya hassleriana TaxID=28532 RepID=UPI00053C7773|nr:PREDICTED: uncharacterized protein LOC104799160 [Tarenaya hassleriana]